MAPSQSVSNPQLLQTPDSAHSHTSQHLRIKHPAGRDDSVRQTLGSSSALLTIQTVFMDCLVLSFQSGDGCFCGSPLHRFLQCCATLLGLILQRGKGRSGGRSVRGSIPWKSWIEACQQKFSHCGKRQRAPDLRWIPSIVICNHDAIKVKLKPCCTAGFFITAISHRLSACVYWEEALASLKSASANNNAIR